MRPKTFLKEAADVAAVLIFFWFVGGPLFAVIKPILLWLIQPHIVMSALVILAIFHLSSRVIQILEADKSPGDPFHPMSIMVFFVSFTTIMFFFVGRFTPAIKEAISAAFSQQ